MPQDHIGVIVFVIGNHSQPLYNIVSYNVYERLLGMDQTPWSERQLEIRLKNKKAGTEARTKANQGQVPDTKASHALADYAGAYENPAYGVMTIGMKDNQLQFDFHKMRLPMTRFHYDRFDTPDDELYGKWFEFATDHLPHRPLASPRGPRARAAATHRHRADRNPHERCAPPPARCGPLD